MFSTVRCQDNNYHFIDNNFIHYSQPKYVLENTNVIIIIIMIIRIIIMIIVRLLLSQKR